MIVTFGRNRQAVSLNEIVSFLITFFLLVIRLADDYLAIWVFGTVTPVWFSAWYAGVIYLLMASLLWLNRKNLSSLNVDKSFVILVIISGVLLFSFYLPAAGILLGLLVIATTLLISWGYQTNRFDFGQTNKYGLKTWRLVFISVLLTFPILILSISNHTITNPISLQILGNVFFQANLFGIVFEELLFRGMVWRYLKRFGLKDRVVILVQALLFWVSHHRMLLLGAQFGFWVAVPLLAVLLGIIVSRSKSITLSTTSHFFYNFVVDLIDNVFR